MVGLLLLWGGLAKFYTYQVASGRLCVEATVDYPSYDAAFADMFKHFNGFRVAGERRYEDFRFSGQRSDGSVTVIYGSHSCPWWQQSNASFGDWMLGALPATYSIGVGLLAFGLIRRIQNR